MTKSTKQFLVVLLALTVLCIGALLTAGQSLFGKGILAGADSESLYKIVRQDEASAGSSINEENGNVSMSFTGNYFAAQHIEKVKLDGLTINIKSESATNLTAKSSTFYGFVFENIDGDSEIDPAKKLDYSIMINWSSRGSSPNQDRIIFSDTNATDPKSSKIYTEADDSMLFVGSSGSWVAKLASVNTVSEYTFTFYKVNEEWYQVNVALKNADYYNTTLAPASLYIPTELLNLDADGKTYIYFISKVADINPVNVDFNLYNVFENFPVDQNYKFVRGNSETAKISTVTEGYTKLEGFGEVGSHDNYDAVYSEPIDLSRLSLLIYRDYDSNETPSKFTSGFYGFYFSQFENNASYSTNSTAGVAIYKYNQTQERAYIANNPPSTIGTSSVMKTESLCYADTTGSLKAEQAGDGTYVISNDNSTAADGRWGLRFDFSDSDSPDYYELKITPISAKKVNSSIQETVYLKKSDLAGCLGKDGKTYVHITAENTSAVYVQVIERGVAKAVSLSLDGDIGANLYIDTGAAALKDSGAYMQITDLTSSENIYSDALIKDAQSGTGDYADCKKFSVKVYPKNYQNELNAAIYLSNGEKVLDIKFSVAACIEYYKNNGSEQLKALATSLERYCIAADEYFSGEQVTETAEMSDVTVNQLEQYQSVTEGSAEGITLDSGSLVLDSTMAVKVYFTLGEGKSIENYTFRVNGQNVSPVQTGEANKYYICCDNIGAKDISKTIVFEISAGNEVLTVKYSGLSYVYKILELYKNQPDGSADKNLSNLAEAVYLYSVAADNYFVSEG